MNIYELEKLATPGELHVRKDTDGKNLLWARNYGMIAEGSCISMSRAGMGGEEGRTEAEATMRMLAHCRNNFMAALDALKVAINTLESTGKPQPGMRQLIAKLETVE